MSDAAPSPAAAPAAAPPAGDAAPKAPAAGSPAGDAAPKAPAAPAAPEKILIKVNGKLRELTRDDAVRELQKGFAARENFEKGATLTKKNQQLLRALADEGQQVDALRQLGVDPEKLAERLLVQRVQQAQMSPEQRRIAELEAEVQRSKHTAQDLEQRQQYEQAAVQEKQIWSDMEAQYTTVIDRAVKAGELAGIAPARVLYHMADEALMNLEYGLQLSPEQLLAEAKQKVASTRDELRAEATKLDGPALLDFLGEDAVNRVLRAAVTKFKGGASAPPLAKPAPIGEPKKEERKFIRPNMIRPPFL